MDTLIILLGVFFIILGIIGSFIPILPGPITSWIGLLLIHFTSAIPYNWTFILTTLAVALLVYILDYIIPALGTKKFGGSKYGIIGTTVGLVVGLIFSRVHLELLLAHSLVHLLESLSMIMKTLTEH